MMREKARSYRAIHLPDKMVGQARKDQYNPLLRKGWYKESVCDLACAFLDEAYADAGNPELDRTQAIAYLVGTLDLPNENLAGEGFPSDLIIGTRIVQGHAFDTPFSHFAALVRGFDWMKVTKAALYLAEYNSLAETQSPRSSRVRADLDPVRRLLLTSAADAAMRLLPIFDERVQS